MYKIVSYKQKKTIKEKYEHPFGPVSVNAIRNIPKFEPWVYTQSNAIPRGSLSRLTLSSPPDYWRVYCQETCDEINKNNYLVEHSYIIIHKGCTQHSTSLSDTNRRVESLTGFNNDSRKLHYIHIHKYKETEVANNFYLLFLYLVPFYFFP